MSEVDDLKQAAQGIPWKPILIIAVILVVLSVIPGGGLVFTILVWAAILAAGYVALKYFKIIS